jgi:Fur family transcriptional regulator, ferric uptake regulator
MKTMQLPATSAPDAEALAEAQLRAKAVRITAARVKVLAALLNARCACSHQDMQESLAAMDRVTLYRALDCLTEAGLAHKIAGDDRVFRYSAGAEHGERAAGATQTPLADGQQHQHGHFKCTRCAKVFCLENAADARLQATLQQLQNSLDGGFQCHEIELTIKGWCADCTH